MDGGHIIQAHSRWDHFTLMTLLPPPFGENLSLCAMGTLVYGKWLSSVMADLSVANLISSVINQEAHLWEGGAVGVFPRRIS